MIDKHTDAQGELPTGDELRALAKRATFSSRDSASPSELVLAGWKAALARRATECQAQTSAARWQECMDVSFCESHGNRQFVGVMLPRPAGNYASTSAEFEAAVDISRAAQLADSTAPGAQSLTAGGAVPPVAVPSPHAEPQHERSYALGWNAARKWAIDNAAAPLPQVQSEVLGRDDHMSSERRDWLEGMSVSMDVSTGDHDAHHRYYGVISEVMDDAHDKHGVTLLVYDAVPNFKPKEVK